MPIELVVPVLVQVALTFTLLIGTALTRVGALRRREVRLGEIALSADAFPERCRQFSNAFANQLELPVLFYLAIVLAMLTKSAGQPFAYLAWGFVASRLVHAYIHTTSNNVRRRFNAFSLGVALVAGMWVLLGVRLLGAAA